MDPYQWGGFPYGGYGGFGGMGYGRQGMGVDRDGYGPGDSGIGDGMGDWGRGNPGEADYEDLFPGAWHGARGQKGVRYGNFGDYEEDFGHTYDNLYAMGQGHRYPLQGGFTYYDDGHHSKRHPQGPSHHDADEFISGAIPSDDDRAWTAAQDRRRARRIARSGGYAPGDLCDRMDGGFSRMVGGDYVDPLDYCEPRSGNSRIVSHSGRDPIENDFFGIRERERSPRRNNGFSSFFGDRERRPYEYVEEVDQRYDDFFGERERRPYANPCQHHRQPGEDRRGGGFRERERRPYGRPY